ncbi:MAG: type III-B CRISPR module-associated protein Cmr5 [Desulfovibrionales bacterium]|nr:MAG: type III-B CRISPR module-associated protein Cmr5 [Desulfovibrionales bacterium]
MNTTKAQQRSGYALEELLSLGCDREKFAKFSAGLPSLILQNGLGQALAFLLAKGKDEHKAGFSIIIKWLGKEKILQSTNDRQAVHGISQLSQQDYLRAQSETLKMLEWLKRYANSDLF